jgi:hypothetical protein
LNSIKFPSYEKDYIPSALEEHSNKISVLVLRKFGDDYIIKHSGKKALHGYINDQLFIVHLSLLQRKYSRMNRIFNIKIDQLIESGIVQRLKDAQYEKSTKIAAKQLIMDHLELCFYAVLIGLSLSFVVFFYEVVIGFLSSM